MNQDQFYLSDRSVGVRERRASMRLEMTKWGTVTMMRAKLDLQCQTTDR